MDTSWKPKTEEILKGRKEKKRKEGRTHFDG
jgi:hypothetical protein